MNKYFLAALLIASCPLAAMETPEDQVKVNNLSFAALHHLGCKFGQPLGPDNSVEEASLTLRLSELEYIFCLGTEKLQESPLLPTHYKQIEDNPFAFCTEEDKSTIAVIVQNLKQRKVAKMGSKFLQLTSNGNNSNTEIPAAQPDELGEELSDVIEWKGVKGMKYRMEGRYNPY